MTNKFKFAAGMVTVFLLSACTANLAIYDSNQKEIKGVPFNAPVAYVIEGNLVKLKKGGKCDPKPFVKFESLPLGKQYFAQVKTGIFADSEFSISFGDKGGLKQITLNSDANFPKTLDSITKFVSEALPTLADSTITYLEKEPALPTCDTGEKITKMTLFSEWLP